jgi:leucyl-tRNA synthetase
VQWTEAGIEGASRFLQRVWKLVGDFLDLEDDIAARLTGIGDAGVLELRKVVHRAVNNVGGEIEGLRFNRAVAQIYELSNAIAKFSQSVASSVSPAQRDALREAVERLVQLVAPMMPHLAETCWAALGKTGLVVDAGWPVADPTLLVESTVVLPVQVNGKRRGEITVPVGAAKELVEKEVLSLEAVARMLEGKPPKKLVIVPDRIVNVVV